MISKSLLIGYIAFNGATLTGSAPFGGGTAGVYGVRNISGWKTGTGVYRLRIGGPVLVTATTPAQIDNEWSHVFGNANAVVTLFGGTGAVQYGLTQDDNNTYTLTTFDHGGVEGALEAADLIVQFSINALAVFP